MKKILVSIILLASGFQSLTAQYDTQLSNYWAAISYFNPAYAGQTGKLEMTGLYRLQWLGVEDAPKTALVTAEMPISLLGRTHGVGLTMMNEGIGFFNHTVVAGQYAYKKELWKGSFSLGLQVGYIRESFAGSKVKIPDNNDYHSPIDESIPTTDVSASGIDGSVGVFYARKKWFAGLSVNHLTQPQLELTQNVILDIPRSYYLVGGYNIQLNNPLLELRPGLLVKSIVLDSVKSVMTTTQIDLSLRMIYNKTYWGGLSWRKDDAVVIMLGGNFKDIQAGYAYDFPISDMLKGSTGSHELFVKYTLDLNLRKGNKNKHKSVRIL